MNIDPYNFELYRFKVFAFFGGTQCRMHMWNCFGCVVVVSRQWWRGEELEQNQQEQLCSFAESQEWIIRTIIYSSLPVLGILYVLFTLLYPAVYLLICYTENNNEVIWHFIRRRNMSIKSLQGRSTPGSRDECRTAQTAADPWTKPTNLSHWPAWRQLLNYIHHRHHYYSARKLIFVLPSHRGVEGWVHLDGWLYTQMVYLPVSSQPSML